MEKKFVTHKDYQSDRLNRIFDSIFYMEKDNRVIEVKIYSVHWYKKLGQNQNITTEVCVEYVTPLGKGQYKAPTLNDLPIWYTPSLWESGGRRAISEHDIKCSLINISEALGIRNYNSFQVRTLNEVGGSFLYYKVSSGKVKQTNAVLIGVHLFSESPAIVNFAEDVNWDACRGIWDACNLAKFKNNHIYPLVEYNPVPHLLTSQEEAEEQLLKSGGVLRFGDTPTEEQPNPLDALNDTIEEYAKRFGFKAEIKFSPLD